VGDEQSNDQPLWVAWQKTTRICGANESHSKKMGILPGMFVTI